MRSIFCASIALMVFAAVSSADTTMPADQGAAAVAPAVAMSPAGHATHDTTGIGTHGHHPKHGKLHGHRNYHECMKHCESHHKAHGGSGEDVKECKSLCHAHHKSHQEAVQSGFKGRNNK